MPPWHGTGRAYVNRAAGAPADGPPRRPGLVLDAGFTVPRLRVPRTSSATRHGATHRVARDLAVQRVAFVDGTGADAPERPSGDRQWRDQLIQSHDARSIGKATGTPCGTVRCKVALLIESGWLCTATHTRGFSTHVRRLLVYRQIHRAMRRAAIASYVAAGVVARACPEPNSMTSAWMARRVGSEAVRCRKRSAWCITP